MTENSDFQKLILENFKEIKETQKEQGKILEKNTEEVREMKEQLKLQNGRVTRLEQRVPELRKEFDLYKIELNAKKKAEKAAIDEHSKELNQRMDAQDEVLNCLTEGQESIVKKLEDSSAIFGGEDEYENALRSIAAEKQFDEWKKKFWGRFWKILAGVVVFIPAFYYLLQILHSFHIFH